MPEKITCHLIAGFLGAGKTHFIQQLASYKPAHERWVILVNEVGQQQYAEASLKAQNIAVKTVLGGCLCCTAGLPFRVALNEMIKEHQPHRIFIEPAGAGHLDNIKTLLQGEFYQPLIHIATIQCLLNTKHLLNHSLREHEHYLRLISQADNLLIYGHDEVTRIAQELTSTYAKPMTFLNDQQGDLSVLS